MGATAKCHRVFGHGFMAIILFFSLCQSVTLAADGGVRVSDPPPAIRTMPETVQAVAAWAVGSNDNQQLPFVVVDKISAQLFIFDAGGQARISTAVLLGQARGDHSVPGIGERPIAHIKPGERTTPAGRFVGEPGRNTGGEPVVWVDYDAALAIHRVRSGPAWERRLERHVSPKTADSRVSYGCIVVSTKFYEQVIAPTFAHGKRIIYVLPETTPIHKVFALAKDL